MNSLPLALDAPCPVDRVEALGQYFTPVWAAEALIDRCFSHLSSNDLVLEPSCGPGRFLKALPAGVPAIGVEIDPLLADQARRETGREIITGDFRTVPLTFHPTAVVGNPPFDLALFDQMLDRCHALLPEGAMAGWIVPAYFFQTPRSVQRAQAKWSTTVEMIPRTLFPGLSKPLVWAMFRKDAQRTMVGFALYDESAAIRAMPEEYQKLLEEGSRPVWRGVIARVLHNMGGEADLSTIYRALEGKRPTGTKFWKEQCRKQLQQHFRRTGEARYALPLAA